MKIAVIGLGIEGNKALHSLLNYGHQVYASDMDKNKSLESLNHECDVELGNHNWNKIDSADAVVLSPSLWNIKAFQNLKSNNKLLSDVLTHHKSIFTIGVTGTNGKTTTCYMIKEILEKYDFKVLMGGNAGGGFDGYTEIILETSQSDYDVLIVEICDMTLDFCAYNFDFDLIVVTNVGYDHLNVHQSIKNYQKSLQKFLLGKKAILNINDELSSNIGSDSEETLFFDCYPGKLNLFGRFNQQNAAAAALVAKKLNVPTEVVSESLESFKPVPGRIEELIFGKVKIIIGKTDNVSAINAILTEDKFDVIIIGTPRKDEYWRYDILKEISKNNPEMVGVFPGLDDTTIQAKEALIDQDYNGVIKILNNTEDVIKFSLDSIENGCNVFIGGNGQEKLMEIEEVLKNRIALYQQLMNK